MYEQYKNINLPWLNEIPYHWDIHRNKNIFTEMKEEVGTDSEQYRLLSLTLNGIIPRDMDGGGKFPGSFEKYKIVKPGYMAFCLFDVDETPRTVGLSNYDGMLTGAYTIMKVHDVNARYVYYYYLVLDNQKMLRPLYTGLRKTINVNTFQSLKIPIPPRTEQDQIVRFLDWKMSTINKMTKIQLRKIYLLEQFRDSFITRLTHYGIHKDAPLEETEIAWLGKIPKSWHIRSFSKIAKVCTNLVAPNEYFDNFHISPASIEKNTGRIIHTQTVQEAGVVSNNHRFFKGQIIYSKIRPLLNKVVIAPFDGLCSADMYPIETSLDIGYLKYFMLSQNFLCQLTMTKNRVKMPKINQDELSNVLVVFPRNAEQVEIVKKADACCRKIQDIIENMRKYVASLDELKTRLIADTVTGKIDVRNIEIPEYEFVGEELQAEEELDAEGSDNGE